MPWGAPSTAVKKRFLRYIYAEGSDGTRADLIAASAMVNTEAARSIVIATETDPALRDYARGKSLSSASANGKSTSYATAQGLDAQQVAELAEWAEDFISYDTIEEALAEVPPPAVALSTDWSALRH